MMGMFVKMLIITAACVAILSLHAIFITSGCKHLP